MSTCSGLDSVLSIRSHWCKQQLGLQLLFGTAEGLLREAWALRPGTCRYGFCEKWNASTDCSNCSWVLFWSVCTEGRKCAVAGLDSERVTDRDRGLCLSLSASWPLRWPILFMQKVIWPCTNWPRQTHMHLYLMLVQLTLFLCLSSVLLCDVVRGIWLFQNSLFNFFSSFSLYAYLPCCKCLGTCGLTVFCGFPCFSQKWNKPWLNSHIHCPQFTYLWKEIGLEEIGTSWNI